jgi:hypothetical protein
MAVTLAIVVIGTLVGITTAGRISGLAASKIGVKGNYTIDLVFNKGDEELNDKYKTEIIRAKDRWETLIVGELPSLAVFEPGTNLCVGTTYTNLPNTTSVKNILIFVTIKEMDGPGNALAASGPCRYDAQLFPRAGAVTIDEEDIGRMFQDNNLCTFSL